MAPDELSNIMYQGRRAPSRSGRFLQQTAMVQRAKIALERENEAFRLDPSAAVAVCLMQSGHVMPSYGALIPIIPCYMSEHMLYYPRTQGALSLLW